VSLTSRDQVLALQVAVLQTRSAALRLAVAEHAQPLRTPLALADQATSTWAQLRAQPVWLMLGAAGLALWRPRRAWRWAARGWWAWRLWRRGQRWLSAGRPGP
jgi:hypothetical protein